MVDLQHLLYRLENDAADVCHRITSLLINSFFPARKDIGVKIARGAVLVEKNAHAARQFYHFLLKYVDAQPVVEFALGLYEALHMVVEQGLVGGGDIPSDVVTAKGKKKGKKAETEHEDGDENSKRLRGKNAIALNLTLAFYSQDHDGDRKEL